MLKALLEKLLASAGVPAAVVAEIEVLLRPLETNFASFIDWTQLTSVVMTALLSGGGVIGVVVAVLMHLSSIIHAPVASTQYQAVRMYLDTMKARYEHTASILAGPSA